MSPKLLSEYVPKSWAPKKSDTRENPFKFNFEWRMLINYPLSFTRPPFGLCYLLTLAFQYPWKSTYLCNNFRLQFSQPLILHWLALSSHTNRTWSQLTGENNLFWRWFREAEREREKIQRWKPVMMAFSGLLWGDRSSSPRDLKTWSGDTSLLTPASIS